MPAAPTPPYAILPLLSITYTVGTTAAWYACATLRPESTSTVTRHGGRRCFAANARSAGAASPPAPTATTVASGNAVDTEHTDWASCSQLAHDVSKNSTTTG